MSDQEIYSRKATICVDFDGVLYSYVSGWMGINHLPDPPVWGTKVAMERLKDMGFRIVVQSTRCASSAGRRAIGVWLQKHGIVVDEVVQQKPPALVYIDDRGLQFKGDWEETLSDLRTFTCWRYDKTIMAEAREFDQGR